MSTWNIYHKDGTKLQDANGKEIVVHELEYSDTWMGECFVTITFENETTIDFAIGDYIEYRNEQFEINYDPGKIKVSSKDSYGAAFKYEQVKFNSLSDELARCEFLDVVLYDNELHYTALPKFSFYVSSLDDLLDRILANLNEQIGENEWKLFSRNLERSKQRGCTEEEWNEMYGEGTEDNIIESKSVTVDNQTCWEALALVNSEWDVNFIVRGRNIYVGTAGLPTTNIFKYGKGNGLYEVDQNADDSQEVITRFRAYGSDKNLPDHYYADLGMKIKTSISDVKYAETKYEMVELVLDLDYDEAYFTQQREYSMLISPTSESITKGGWVLKVTFDYNTVITGYVTENKADGKCYFYSEPSGDTYDTGDEPSKENLRKFKAECVAGKTLYITSGVHKDLLPVTCKEALDNIPNNMACDHLMLPGFPQQSLKDFWDSLTDEEKAYVNPSGREHYFSENKYRPYIDSVNINELGVRQGSVYFDADDEKNGIIEIYPSMEEMTTSTGQRLDEIYEGSSITDDGRFDDGQTVPNFTVLLRPEIDFNINDLKQSDFTIHMKDGMCGGREFSVAGSVQNDGVWKLTLERVKDDALKIYFPYKDYQIKAGDHFVLTGIELPDSYVRAASLKLLKWAIAYLDANDYTRYVYQPKVDEIFMAKQHDEYLADKSGTKKSLYLSLKAGDLLSIEEKDFGIEGEITIDQLTITEKDGKIPTYEITLRDDKEVGTIEKIQNQITSLTSGNGGGIASSTTTAQTKSLIAKEGQKYFLSKVDDDTASGNMTFEKNVEVEQNLEVKGTTKFGTGYSISSDGTAVLGDTTAKDVTLTSITSKDYAKELFQGFSLAPGANGSYKLEIGDLEVWGKASFAQLEIRKVSYAGGTVVYSNAGSTLKRVASVTDADGNVIAYKCWAVADDGTTQTMNWWTVGMMALCQTFNVQDGTNTDQEANHYYWRLVIGKGQETLEDGKLYDYILLSNKKTFTGSDAVVPVYTDKCWAEQNDKVIIFGSVAVAQCDRAMGTMAEGCDVSKDDGGTAVSSRTFYGYADGSDAPQADDVIVQVGDQVSWLLNGNLVMITTYNLNANGNLPSIAMYHSMGNLYAGTDGTANPYQWKTLTHLFSPKKTLVNSECFQFFTGSEDNVVSPITTTYDIIPSVAYLKKKDGTTEVDDIQFSVNKHYGSDVEQVEPSGFLKLTVSTEDETYSGMTYIGSVCTTLMLSGHADVSLDDITAISAFIEKDGVVVAQCDIPVINDGEDGKNGTSVTIKGSLTSTDDLPTSGNTNGDGYMIDGNLWVYTGTTTTDTTHVHGFENVGNIKGEDGKPGTDGQSAYDVVIEGAPLVYETNDNGIVTDLSATAKIKVYQKGGNVTALFTPTFTCTNCEATVKRGLTDTVTITKIDTQTVSDYTMSQQAGMVDVTLTYGSTTLHAQVPFQVNVVKLMGSFKADNKKLESKYTEVSNQTTANTEELKNKANTADVATELTELESSLTQTARQISLSVSEKAIGRRNMLVGSAARAYGEGWTWLNGGSYEETVCEQIDSENGVDGTHALHCYSVKTGTDSYINAGFRWVGGAPQGNIKVEKGKSYTISFYAKATDLEKVCFVLEAIYEGSATDYSRPAVAFSEAFSVDNNNTWQLITKTISVPSDAKYEYLEICLFVRAKADTTGLHDGWLCRPMMEEGSVYNGWTQSTGDSDYLTSSDMKRAGIDIDSSSVTLYGDQVKVKNGDTTTALFSDGKVTASMLNATQIVTDGLQAQTIDAKQATIKNLTVESANVTGKVTAQKGQIAGLRIDNNSLTNITTDSSGKTTDNDAYIILKNSTDATWASIGTNTFDAATSMTAPARFTNGNDSQYAVRRHVGVYAQAKGSTTGNFAFFASAGDLFMNEGLIQGFRLATKQVSASTATLVATPTTSDPFSLHTSVMCTSSTADQVITLPSGAPVGQVFYLHQWYGRWMYLKTSSGESFNTNGSEATQLTLKDGCMNFIMKVDKTHWSVWYMPHA